MQEMIYSVLIVSSQDGFTQTIQKLLGNDYSPVNVVGSIAAAKRMILEREFDICIINSPLGDDFGTDFAIDVAESSECGIIMFAKPEVYDEVYDKTSKFGVLLLSKPTSGAVFKQTLRLLCSSKERIGRINQKNVKEKKTLEQRLEEIRLINNAKLLLIEHRKISEDEAHKYLERRAMDLRKSKLEIAQEVIEEYRN